jgi:hypothetical protein
LNGGWGRDATYKKYWTYMLSNAGQIGTYLTKSPERIIIHDRFINFQPKQVFMKEEKSGQFVEVFLNIPTVGEIPEIQDNYSRPFVHYFKRYGAFFSLQSSQLEIWTVQNLAKAGHEDRLSQDMSSHTPFRTSNNTNSAQLN